MILRRGVRRALPLVAGAVLLAACSRGKDDGDPAAGQVTTSPSASPMAESPAPLPPPTPAPEPSPAPTPEVSPTPAGPTPTPAPRNVNGLMVVDEVWSGIVREPGGLRLRSAPRVEPGNVVGSVAEGTLVTVEGRILNGQEAEQGKGTVWLLVGPGQYIYAAPGYVERIR